MDKNIDSILPRVLIVDDEELICNLLSEYLLDKGFEPSHFEWERCFEVCEKT